jgi:hypothetical protein
MGFDVLTGCQVTGNAIVTTQKYLEANTEAVKMFARGSRGKTLLTERYGGTDTKH